MRTLALLAVALHAQAASAARYSLDELLARVRKENPGVESARAAVATARALLGQAQMQWTPFGDFNVKVWGTPTVHNGSYTGGYVDDFGTGLSTTYVDWLHAGRFQGESALPNAEPFQGAQFTIGFGIVQPLYTFGKISAAIGAAKGGVTVAEGYAAAALADAELEAMRSYWLVKCHRAAQAVMGDIVARLEKQVAEFQSDMEGSNKAGYTEADLARLKAALENARVTLFDLARQEAGALASLKALARDPAGDVDEGAPALAAEPPRTRESYQDAGATHRAEIKLLEGGKQAARHFVKWRFADLLPSFVFLTSFSYSAASSVENPLSSSVIGVPTAAFPYPGLGPLLMHWDLDFAPRWSRLVQARAAERAMREVERWARGGIRVEVEQAWANHDEAVHRASELAHAEKVARGWYGAVEDNLASGITVATDARELVDAMRAYFDFRLRHLLAILDANLTLAWLERASGTQ